MELEVKEKQGYLDNGGEVSTPATAFCGGKVIGPCIIELSLHYSM